MQMIDIISKKRDGKELTQEEIKFFINNYVSNKIPDYQVSALTMAIYFKGMNKKEIAYLTDAMLHSGNVIDLSSIEGIKIDKHSTGGVGDKTSLVLGPLVSACGAKVAKMSGRGLGHTGGTLDKLESIKGLSIDVSEKDFVKQVNEIGIAIIGQTGDLVPADKKLYALRDVTCTVDSIPLIASSIMSKKLASGSDTILLDVKFGSGAFMKDLSSAEELALTMVEIGKTLNKDTKAVITDMDQPLGRAVGNSIEVIEAAETLKGRGPSDLVELCVSLGSIILMQAKITSSLEEGRNLLIEKINNGEAFNKLKQLVTYQGGDASFLDDYSKFKQPKYTKKLYSSYEGFIKRIDAIKVGEAAMHLGAGRATKDDVIDMSAGILLNKKVGDYVKLNEELLTYYTDIDNVNEIENELLNAFEFSDKEITNIKIIHKVID